ncbi:hypothetical protein Tco_1508935 [Tanacetum coccineum]
MLSLNGDDENEQFMTWLGYLFAVIKIHVTLSLEPPILRFSYSRAVEHLLTTDVSLNGDDENEQSMTWFGYLFVIIEKLVKFYQKARIMELIRRNHEEHSSNI